MRLIVGCLISACLFAGLARAADFPVTTCKVSHVTDGDTFRCIFDPPLWGPYRETQVRIAGIDTPESRKPPGKCVKEVRLGKIAKAEMKRRVAEGSIVALQWTGEKEKYGRVLANVTLPDGSDWGEELIRMGVARAYTGGKKSNWCR